MNKVYECALLQTMCVVKIIVSNITTDLKKDPLTLARSINMLKSTKTSTKL